MSPAPPPGPATTSRKFTVDLVVPYDIPDDYPEPHVMALRELQKRSGGYVIDADSVLEVTATTPQRFDLHDGELVQVHVGRGIAVGRTWQATGYRVALPDPETVYAGRALPGTVDVTAVDVPARGRVEVVHDLGTEAIRVTASLAGRPAGVTYLALDENTVEVIARASALDNVTITIADADPDEGGESTTPAP